MKRTEIVKPTTPADDAKGLSADVPPSIAVGANIERVLMIRMKNQADILEELEKQVRAHNIVNAIFLNGTGSVISTHYHVVSNRTFPSKNLHVENPTAAADLLSFSGMVMNGKIHAHMTLGDGEKSFGGHLESGTRVFTFAVIVIGVLPENIDISRFDDKTWR